MKKHKTCEGCLHLQPKMRACELYGVKKSPRSKPEESNCYTTGDVPENRLTDTLLRGVLMVWRETEPVIPEQ